MSGAMVRGAQISACGHYRYDLYREWRAPLIDPAARGVLFIMLNPSTADAKADDPTIRKCIGFARTWGYCSLHVANLYAWRATKPADLWAAEKAGHNIIGPGNDDLLIDLARSADLVVCAWGANQKAQERAKKVYDTLSCPPHEIYLNCLRLTEKTGAPEHPLYVPYRMVQPYYGPRRTA